MKFWANRYNFISRLFLPQQRKQTRAKVQIMVCAVRTLWKLRRAAQMTASCESWLTLLSLWLIDSAQSRLMSLCSARAAFASPLLLCSHIFHRDSTHALAAKRPKPFLALVHTVHVIKLLTRLETIKGCCGFICSRGWAKHSWSPRKKTEFRFVAIVCAGNNWK